ncbi:MAG: DNA methyltransferase [Pseudomonadota bacterium]
MTPQAFIAKWHGNALTEKAGAQAHFEDLCALLGVEPPRVEGEYQYERGLIKKSSASQGWADVWKRGCFAWEYKAPDKGLGAALKQLMVYALALDNPPLLVVSDRKRIEIHTHFTGTPSEVHTILLDDIGQPQHLQKLRWLFDAPDNFKPKRSTYAITEEAAQRLGKLAERLNAHDRTPLQTAHFLIQCVFCIFAEDARLLPHKLFETVLDKSNPDGAKAQSRLTELFTAMRKGGDFALETIPYFNGGLFELIDVPPLTTQDVVQLLDAARMGWGEVEPAILGTLFERGLNPDMRSQLGAHYTDPATILKLIRPVIEAPLLAEWEQVKARIAEHMPVYIQGGKGSQTAHKAAQAEFFTFIQRLKAYRVLDPACGSGNFLYLALKTLKDLEHRANLEAEALGLHRELVIETSPENVLGIELNPYAAELARVTVWIGEIQWMLMHGYELRRNPILRTLDHIECRDAVLNFSPSHLVGETATESTWPAADAIVGNPPFLGGGKKRGELGNEYFNALNRVYKDRIPGSADLVTYWFDKARAQIAAGKSQRAGLVATNSIRQQSNRIVLDAIVKNSRIYEAWSDEPWINHGASVRVSLVCFGNGIGAQLDGKVVDEIHADLRTGDNLTSAIRLSENVGASFFGLALAGNFNVNQSVALKWLKEPNPHGRPNSNVLRPLWNGKDLTGRWDGRWVIDFGPTMEESDAMLYEAPFKHIVDYVKPVRLTNNRKSRAEKWWRHGEARPAMRRALAGLGRYIATSEKSKHRFFIWLDERIAPDNRLIVIPRNDDINFGILSSRIHVCWALAVGSTLEDRPAYATTTCFETFPFPAGLTPRDTAAPPERVSPTCYADSLLAESIGAAARHLNSLRETWLNPPEWVDWVRTAEEERAGFPLRPVAKPGHEAALKQRTLTNLYNAHPAWLAHAHRELDAAVAAAYGWADYMPEMPDTEMLKRLLALNLDRARLEI